VFRVVRKDAVPWTGLSCLRAMLLCRAHDETANVVRRSSGESHDDDSNDDQLTAQHDSP
jgi:hypothetical protein